MSYSKLHSLKCLLMRIEALTIFLILFLNLGIVWAESGQKAQLRLAAGLSTAVWRADIDDNDQYLVTYSHDKTVIAWPLKQQGEPVTYYFPLRNEEKKRAHAVAISPSSEHIVYGVPKLLEANKSFARVYVVERITGKIIKVIDDLPTRAQALAFSPDGYYLVASLSGGAGLRAWSTKSWDMVADYADSEMGETNQVAIEFGKNGKGETTAIAMGGANGIWMFSSPPEFKPITRFNYKNIDSLSFSPDGSKLAIGGLKAKSVKIINVLTGDLLYVLETPAQLDTHFISRVGWSRDGQCVFGSGMVIATQPGSEPDKMQMIAWNISKSLPPISFDSGSDITMDLAPYGQNGMLFVTQDPMIGGYYCDGKPVIIENDGVEFPILGSSLDLRDSKRKYPIWSNHEGTKIAFRPFGKNKLLLFDVQKETLRIEDVRPKIMDKYEDLLAPIRGTKKMEFEIMENLEGSDVHKYPPLLNRKKLTLAKEDISRNYAVSRSNEQALWGTSDTLRLLDQDAKEKWNISIAAEAYRVAFSGDGKRTIVGHSDGTIRWYNTENHELLLTLFVHADLKRWVLWTKSGFYNTSVNGETLVGWIINDKEDKTAVFQNVGRFREDFYIPDLTKHVLLGGNEASAVSTVGRSRGGMVEDSADTIRKEHTAKMTIVYPLNNDEITDPQLEITFSLRRANAVPVNAVDIKLNDALLKTLSGPFNYDKVGESSDVVNKASVQIPEELRIKDKTLRIRLRAKSEHGKSDWEERHIQWKGKGAAAERRPRLWALIVGISNYAKTTPLMFADDDAVDWEEYLVAQGKALYPPGGVVNVAEAEANRKRIVDELLYLKNNAKDNDVSIIYLAGHGIMHEREYYFLTKDADPEEEGDLFTMAISGEDIRRIMSGVKGKKFIFVDTCRAKLNEGIEMIDPVWFQNTAIEETHAMVFLASGKGEYAHESIHYGDGNGLFTHVLLEGLGGDAESVFWNNKKRDYVITAGEIENYLYNRFESINAGNDSLRIYKKGSKQYPSIAYPPDVGEKREYRKFVLSKSKVVK